MQPLTLSNDERTLLARLVENRLKELPHEIHQTDSRTFRDALLAEQQSLEQLAGKLQPT